MGKIQAPTGCQSCSSGKKYHARHLYSSCLRKREFGGPGAQDCGKHSSIPRTTFIRTRTTPVLENTGLKGPKLQLPSGRQPETRGSPTDRQQIPGRPAAGLQETPGQRQEATFTPSPKYWRDAGAGTAGSSRGAVHKCFAPNTGAFREQLTYAAPWCLRDAEQHPKSFQPKYCCVSRFSRANSGPDRMILQRIGLAGTRGHTDSL